MACPIVGETVFVRLRRACGTDAHGNDAFEWFGREEAQALWESLASTTWGDHAPESWEGHSLEDWADALGRWGDLPPRLWGELRRVVEAGGMSVDNVLVGPGAPLSAAEPGRPHATQVSVTFYFPKGFDEDVRGALIACRGGVYEAVGEPERFTDANVPGPWNLVVPAVRRDGG